MALKAVSSQATLARAPLASKAVLPVRRSVRSLAVRAQAQDKPAFEVGKAVAAVSAASTALVASNAQAATQVAELAANDNRAGIILTLFVPALGWVAFNILQPFLNQLNRMDELKSGVVGGVGLTAFSLLLAEQAQAATQVADLAASDNRAGIILTLFLPALGWVAFNILQPFLNQLNRMDELKNGVVGGLSLTALSFLLAEQAEAATQVAELAANDNRAGIILTLFLPALGWVAFNILQPFLNQLNRMDELRD